MWTPKIKHVIMLYICVFYTNDMAGCKLIMCIEAYLVNQRHSWHSNGHNNFDFLWFLLVAKAQVRPSCRHSWHVGCR